MTTKEIGKYGLQCNMISAKVEGTSAVFLLANGKLVTMECKTPKEAEMVVHTIMYYPIVTENAGFEFRFEVKVKIE